MRSILGRYQAETAGNAPELLVFFESEVKRGLAVAVPKDLM